MLLGHTDSVTRAGCPGNCRHHGDPKTSHTRNKIVPVHTVPPAMRTEPSRPSPRLSARQLDLQLANIMNSIGLPFGSALANLWIFLVPARPDLPMPGAVHGQAYSENNKPMHP
jgi:hypothetical protein